MKAPNGCVTTENRAKKKERNQTENSLQSSVKCKIKGAAKRRAFLKEKMKVLGLGWLWKLELIFFC